jgi:hypothetical protein
MQERQLCHIEKGIGSYKKIQEREEKRKSEAMEVAAL